MATQIYKPVYLKTIDGTEFEVTPLKIKYMRLVMDEFSNISNSKNDFEVIGVLVACARLALKQFFPQTFDMENVEDMFDLPTIYKLLEVSAGIKINAKSEEPVQNQAEENMENSSWDTLDLVKLESEAFLLGIWKNFDELESSVSVQELITIISRNRELDYEEKKFLAAIQGVDIEKDSNKGQKEWENLKARVFSKGKATDSNDVLSLQGINAQKVGFGIGMGLDYEDLT